MTDFLKNIFRKEKRRFLRYGHMKLKRESVRNVYYR